MALRSTAQPFIMPCREYRKVEEEALIKRVGNNGTVVRKHKVICSVKITEDVGYVAIIRAFA
jgi:hypothetical protein